MSEMTYMVVFRGELVEGADLEEVKESLRNLCKITHDKVEQLFALPAVVLKKNLTHELAESFKHQLERIGVITDVTSMGDAKVVSANAEQHDAGISHSGNEAVSLIRTEKRTGHASLDRMPLQFNGQGGEYFKIWIVNIVLSILTLGIYSAWAKVRNHRYFYSNTQIGNASFEYTAEPMAILKGRIIAVIFLLAISLSGEFIPILALGLQLIVIVLLPAIINRSMAFRNRNTVYRNVRFGFDGNYMGALKAFVLWPLAGIITLGILLPYAAYRQEEYIVQGSRYGRTHFEAQFGWREVYGISIRAFLAMLVAVALVLVPFVGPLLALPLYLLAFAYFTANMANLVYNKSKLKGHGFESTLKSSGLAMLYFTNWLLVAFTLGLATPWAKVRLTRYHADNLALLAAGPLDEFIAAEEENVAAFGEEIGEAFDMDIGL